MQESFAWEFRVNCSSMLFQMKYEVRLTPRCASFPALASPRKKFPSRCSMKPKMRAIISPGRKQLSTTSNRDISQHTPRNTATTSVQGWKWETKCWRLTICARWRFRDNSSNSCIWLWQKRMWMPSFSLQLRLRLCDWIRKPFASGRTSIRLALCCCATTVRQISPAYQLFPFRADLRTQDCPPVCKSWAVSQARRCCSASRKSLSVPILNIAGRRSSVLSLQRRLASS